MMEITGRSTDRFGRACSASFSINAVYTIYDGDEAAKSPFYPRKEEFLAAERMSLSIPKWQSRFLNMDIS